MEKNNIHESCASLSDLQPIHNDLLELVQKNNTIPDFLNRLTPDDPKLLCLKKAIHKGNFRAHIWNNPDCNLYLIHLIQKKMISFWEGITAYVYLIAKMQYTQTQKLRLEDQDVKFNYQVNIVPFVKGEKITELGYQYLFGMARALETLKVYLNFSQLVSDVLKLPRIEQWLIQTEFDHHMTSRGVNHDSNHLISILMNNLPLMQPLSGGSYVEATTKYFVPSSSIINYCLQALNKQPMRMRPVLGNLGLATLYHWHAQDFHPVALYATQILSNPKSADGYRCGPFALWLHDIGHTFWASMLSKSQRDYIFTTYIPALRRLKDIAKAYRDDFSSEFLKEAEIKAYDFDLTAIMGYADVERRFDTYLAHTIGKSPIYPGCVYTGVYEYTAIGQAEGDTLYFLLHYGLHAAEVPDAYKKVYTTLINFISIGEGYRDQRIVKTLQALAKNAASHPEALFAHDLLLGKLDFLDWKMLLSSNRSSEELWLAMTGNMLSAEALLNLIEQGLNFFHPYLPMTATKRLAWLDSLEKQQPADAKISKDPCSDTTIANKFRPQFFSIHENDSNTLSSSEPNGYTHSHWIFGKAARK